MRRLALALMVLLALAAPAEAHKLKLFAAVEGNTIRGYAFFIGGGRAADTSLVVKDATGAELMAGTTDGGGNFRIELPKAPASDVTITVDTHEGHIASATLSAARFGPTPVPAALQPTAADPPVAPAAPASSDDDARIGALVDAAVARQVEPLREEIAAMDSRLRLVDIVSGVFLILGLAGMASWRRRK